MNHKEKTALATEALRTIRGQQSLAQYSPEASKAYGDLINAEQAQQDIENELFLWKFALSRLEQKERFVKSRIMLLELALEANA